MKIVVWSDFVCPFCYIGKKNLEVALLNLNLKVPVEMKSYELDPHFKREHIEPMNVQLARKYGITVEEAALSQKRIESMAHSVGLEYNSDTMINGNTLKAHRLLQMAKKSQKGTALFDAYTKAVFVQGADIEDDRILKQHWLEVGLSEDAFERAFSETWTEKHVQEDEYEAYSKQIRGVPYFEIDGVVVQGAQPPEVFEGVLTQTMKHYDTSDYLCVDGVCMIG